MRFYRVFSTLALLSLLVSCYNTPIPEEPETSIKNVKGTDMSDKVVKTEDEWKKILTPEQYHIAREKGTERAFTGEYDNHYEKGTYHCVACGNELFRSNEKFKSGSGWPSFWQPISEEKIDTETDMSLGMKRVEVLCNRCGAHLGHVFEDGPPPTNLRYCINSRVLDFEKAE